MTEIREKQASESVNPFTAVWIRTRKAVRYTIEAKSTGYAIMLMLLSGIGSGLMGLQSSGLNETMSIGIILIGALLLFPVLGLASSAVFAAIYLVTGKLFKGTATYIEMLKAVGTAMIPYIWLAPLLILWILWSPDSYFANPFAMGQPSGADIALIVVYLTVATVISIWSLIIHSKAIGEAHRFSAWKGFFTMIIPMLLIGILVFAMVLLFFIFVAGAGIF